MESRVHGAAGAAVVIEECLVGEEVSFFALCDGDAALPLGAAQDHKRVGEGDTGPNTGGMGAYSPPPAFTDALRDEVMARIVRPTLAEMARRGTPFRGVLFAGLMLTATGPRLIEFNVRFGDPECQALMLRLRSDLLAALLAACDGRLAGTDLRWSDAHSLVVVMAAPRLSRRLRKGAEIRGLDRAAAVPRAQVFHAGTARGRRRRAGGERRARARRRRDGRNVARRRATPPTDAAAAIDWPEGFYRRDIGHRALR